MMNNTPIELTVGSQISMQPSRIPACSSSRVQVNTMHCWNDREQGCEDRDKTKQIKIVPHGPCKTRPCQIRSKQNNA